MRVTTGQRVAINWKVPQERWEGTVVNPAWVQCAGQPTMALVEWECGTEGAEAVFPGRHLQIHPHADLQRVLNK